MEDLHGLQSLFTHEATWWLLVAIFLGIIEMLTVSLQLIWFALGALAAFIMAALGFNIVIQIIVFVLVTGITLLYTKPFVQRKILKKTVPTNADRLIGKIAVITEQVDNIKGKGAAKVEGKTWTARAEKDNQIIKVNEKAEIKAIEGVKLIVEKTDPIKKIEDLDELCAENKNES